MSKVRVGFIGVGGMAEHHIKTLQKLESAELTAVYDLNAERAKQVGLSYGAEAFASGQQLIDSGKVDALFICTPPFARDELEVQAAAKGIHLLAEKPVGLHLEEARRRSTIIRESGIVNSSGYCLRYLETVQKAKRYLEGKQINMVLAYRIGGLPSAAWWSNKSLSGGQMVEQSTHQVDLVRYLAGEFEEARSVYAQRSIRSVHPDATISDTGVVAFTMRSGAIGSIVNTCASRHFGRGDVEVFGEGFYLCIKGKSLTIIDDGQKLNEECTTDFYLEQDRAFIEAIRTGRPELVLGDYAEAVVTLEATLAFNESAETGAAVTIAGA